MTIVPDGLTSQGYSALKRNYKAFQRRVYDALAELTPTKFQFIMNCRKDSMSFNWEGIDAATYRFIGDVLAELIGDPKLLITEHDLLITHSRFRELIWKFECVRQGMLKEVTASDGSVQYVMADDAQPTSTTDDGVLYRKVRKRHWARIKPANVPGDNE
jgi:hypothetical protein